VLDFFLQFSPWDYIYQGMLGDIPAGSFYLQTLDMAPRTSQKTQFVLLTDNSDLVRISVNGQEVLKHIPAAQFELIGIDLAEPPAISFITATNGIDPQVNLAIASTHIAKHFFVNSREIFEFSGFWTQKIFNLIRSPWTAFLVEYQLPFKDSLPDNRIAKSWRAMAVRMSAVTLFNDSGTHGGVTDLATAFGMSTPVVDAPVNPLIWQPDLYQPQTSGHDVGGFQIHSWFPNLCLNQWKAFSKFINNVDQWSVQVKAEEAIIIKQLELEDFYQQHLFSTIEDPECTITGLFDFLGCFDNIIVAGQTFLTGAFGICAWSKPFDEQVEDPGIGGEFFDEGEEFDTGSHDQPDFVNGVTTDDSGGLLAESLALATEIRIDYNAHDLDASPAWHHASGGSYQITAAVPSDLPTLITFCLDLQTQYANHLADVAMHIPADTINTLTVIVPADLPTCTSLINDFKAKFNAHLIDGHFDSIYDVDQLTDFWVGTSTTLRFDSGGCLDSFSQVVRPTTDTSCCSSGPDGLVFSTLTTEMSVTSSVTPTHPLFGGDDPGLLNNPYFNP
jgi:hypothetical protein